MKLIMFIARTNIAIYPSPLPFKGYFLCLFRGSFSSEQEDHQRQCYDCHGGADGEVDAEVGVFRDQVCDEQQSDADAAGDHVVLADVGGLADGAADVGHSERYEAYRSAYAHSARDQEHDGHQAHGLVQA